MGQRTRGFFRLKSSRQSLGLGGANKYDESLFGTLKEYGSTVGREPYQFLNFYFDSFFMHRFLPEGRF
jgi:hypothetical protein